MTALDNIYIYIVGDIYRYIVKNIYRCIVGDIYRYIVGNIYRYIVRDIYRYMVGYLQIQGIAESCYRDQRLILLTCLYLKKIISPHFVKSHRLVYHHLKSIV